MNRMMIPVCVAAACAASSVSAQHSSSASAAPIVVNAGSQARSAPTLRYDASLGTLPTEQGWDFELLKTVLPKCVDLDLAMIEQPLPRGKDDQLASFDSPITLAADESCLHCGELETAVSRYSMINIKLDKTGGLTEALKHAEQALSMGFELMVGNMLGSSLAMAPSSSSCR